MSICLTTTIIGTNRLIVDAIRSDATNVAEETQYLTAISNSTGVKCLLSIQNFSAFND